MERGGGCETQGREQKSERSVEVRMPWKNKKGVGKNHGRTNNKKKRVKAKAAEAEKSVMKWAGVTCITPTLIDLHSHSTCSDGLLTPELVVARAYRNGVRVLALTDHDTMSGLPAALGAARQFGIRVIPGIEISGKYVTRSKARGGSVHEEPVHILAYYGCCGPSNCVELEERLAEVREGRYRRAQEMVRKLTLLQKPITMKEVLRIAGPGVAPARPHVARALVEAGHVESVGQAFIKYLHNHGPAYATCVTSALQIIVGQLSHLVTYEDQELGAELPVEVVVSLIRRTGGMSVLAHPWGLKDPIPLIERLMNVGLDAMEVYRSDGKSPGLGPLADAYNLMKLGGSDFHGRGDHGETDLGGVALPPLAVNEFLKLAEPVWSSATEQIIQDFANGTLKEVNVLKGDMCMSSSKLLGGAQTNVVALRLSPWLSEGEKSIVEAVTSRLGLTQTLVDVDGRKAISVHK